MAKFAKTLQHTVFFPAAVLAAWAVIRPTLLAHCECGLMAPLFDKAPGITMQSPRPILVFAPSVPYAQQAEP